MILFSKPSIYGNEEKYVSQVLRSGGLAGDGVFTEKCHRWFEKNTGTKKALLTTSCTHALEMAAILLDIQPGDEVIMPSFTFVSTANAFVLRGAKIIFVDIRPDTMNIDETKIEAAITKKTKVIVPVHYAGVACEMDTIMAIAKKHNLYVVEDAAQAIGSRYNGKTLGTIGDLGTYSFHETKNLTCGEGGVLLVNNEQFAKRAEIIREKGTNRSQFFRGEVNKYEWKDIGSSYLLSELNAAVLLAQLENMDAILRSRMDVWEQYYEGLQGRKGVEVPFVPEKCLHNAHIFYLKCRDLKERENLLSYLKKSGIPATFHYVPLHSSPAGEQFGSFQGEEKYTTKESERLLRLPLYGSLTETGFITQRIIDFVTEK